LEAIATWLDPIEAREAIAFTLLNWREAREAIAIL